MTYRQLIRRTSLIAIAGMLAALGSLLAPPESAAQRIFDPATRSVPSIIQQHDSDTTADTDAIKAVLDDILNRQKIPL